MKNLGIKSRVILLGTIPALLFTIILIGYALSNIFSALNQSLQDRGKVIASQLAPAAEYGVISGNSQILQRLVQQALSNDQDLRTVLIMDNQGLTLALSGRKLPKELTTMIMKEDLQVFKQEYGYVFTVPVYRSWVEIEDFVNLNSRELEENKRHTPEKIGRVFIVLSDQTLLNLKQGLIVRILLIGIFGLLLSALLAWKIGRNITKPIQEIAHAVNIVGEGVFSYTVDENSSGELKILQKGFNSMSASLKSAYDNMQERINDATSMLRYQAQHDDLTGLINRREFEVRLARCLKSIRKNNTQHVFCYLDLDQFKLVNDTCGHSAGDELLKQVSVLLTHKMRERDTLARLGGDEFGLLLENCSLPDAHQIINAFLKIIQDYRFIHEDKIFNIGVSIGLVVINQGFENVSNIIHAGDSACYSAKSAGRNQSFLFNAGDIEVVKQRRAVEAISDMTDEIDDESFLLYCQPIVSLTPQNQHQHYEILLRKVDLDGNTILPTTFIPSAERYHLMPNIDRWVIKNVFIAYCKLQDINKEKCNYLFSINLSGTSLSDKSLLGFIQDMFEKYPVPPASICFEITETAAIVNLKNTILLFSALRKLGCSFALDDFGSGMSSFTYLKNFDVDYLKIDGAFVKEMHINKIDHAMVRSIHNVAEAMNIKTVAEFVENDEILNELKLIGIHYGQGFYLGHPVSMQGLIEIYSGLHAIDD